MIPFPEPAPAARPLWLVTLADLSLLLVGFVLLLQALARQDPTAVAAGIRQGFAGSAVEVPAMPVAAAGVDGFAPGSAMLPRPAREVADWAIDAARDPRVTITVTGETDGTAADRDPTTGSPAILAADRARALAVALAAAGVPPARLALATGSGRRRAATATLAFAGEPTSKAN